MNKIIKLINRIIIKIIRSYRKQVFKAEIGCSHSNFSILGEITLINKNIKIGDNVTFYPGVMFWGDGPILASG